MSEKQREHRNERFKVAAVERDIAWGISESQGTIEQEIYDYSNIMAAFEAESLSVSRASRIRGCIRARMIADRIIDLNSGILQIPYLPVENI